MKKIFEEKNESWHPYFAWDLVYLSNENLSIFPFRWLTTVERRWVPFWSDGINICEGFYQYRKLKK